MNPALLDILVCPLCHQSLDYDQEAQTLTCSFDRLVYPIDKGIPVMLPEQAVALAEDA
jgi:uncharacterized protein YbaR (Trm112 family)